MSLVEIEGDSKSAKKGKLEINSVKQSLCRQYTFIKLLKGVGKGEKQS